MIIIFKNQNSSYSSNDKNLSILERIVFMPQIPKLEHLTQYPEFFFIVIVHNFFTKITAWKLYYVH